ncbi:SDR family oxidoreductase, partial [bacterium]
MTTTRFALVTGGTSGIGKAVALGLAKAGWVVTICGRRAELVEEISRDGQVDGAVCDVTKPDEV